MKTRTGRVFHRSAEPIPVDECALIAPSINAESPHVSRSGRYSFLSTRNVLEGLTREGFLVHAISQGGSRDAAKRSYTKHLLRLRHPSVPIIKSDGVIPEIILLNSHDGTSSYRLESGLFRCACANGLIVSSGFFGEFDAIRLRHRDLNPDAVAEACHALLRRFPEICETVKELDSLEVPMPMRVRFVHEALALRFPDPDPMRERIFPHLEVLLPERPEDDGMSLWKTLNIVQEKLVNGGIQYQSILTTPARTVIRNRRVRPIRSIDADIEFNRSLWSLAEKFRDDLRMSKVAG